MITGERTNHVVGNGSTKWFIQFDVILVAQTAHKNESFKTMLYGKSKPSNKKLYLEQYSYISIVAYT